MLNGLSHKACQSEVARLDNLTPITLTIPESLQKKNASVLPKVGREPDVIPMTSRQVQFAQQYSSSSSLYLSSSNTTIKPAYLTPRINSYPGQICSIYPWPFLLSCLGGHTCIKPMGLNSNPGGINSKSLGVK